MRPGCWDVNERVKDIDAGGILGSTCFLSFPGFAARLFDATEDKDLALAVLGAYNDWHVDEWGGSAPGRFIPMGIPVMRDPKLAAEEVRRLADKGVHSLTFTENDMHHLWTGQDFGDKRPSDVFREHFLTCFISDPVGVKLRDMIGLDNIAWELDYPHSDSS